MDVDDREHKEGTKTMKKTIGMMLLMIGSAGFAVADGVWGGSVPEISAGGAGGLLALLSGAVLVIRGRRNR